MNHTTPEKSPLHHRLRQASKHAHHSLDHHPLLAPLLKPKLGTEQYAHALAALHSVQAEAEFLIHAYLDKHPELSGFRPQRRLSLLEADLAALQQKPFAGTVGFTEPQSVGELIGLMYTVEGSNMGGQVIAKTLCDLGSAHLPMQFFVGYRDTARQYWENFLHFADTVCPADQYDLAANTAATLFDMIGVHLDNAYRSEKQ
jgi:heme oxygenase